MIGAGHSWDAESIAARAFANTLG